MLPPDVVFTLLYILISFCLVYPPTEFVTSGFTIANLFSGFLGSEKTQFIEYHLKLTCLNLLIYSLFPLVYVLCLFVFGFESQLSFLFIGNSILWKSFATSSVLLPLLALYQIKKWTDNDYHDHPIVINISKFCNSNNNTDWRSVARDIETEFRRVEKVCIQTNSITKIVATENWILKVLPLTIAVMHQSDASLSVKQAESYNMSHVNQSETQFLNIEVKSSRRGVEPFVIRINATDFKDLQDRVARSIVILPNVKFHRSVLDQFVDVFKETVKKNAIFETNQDLDQCIGCLQTRSNIKIQKLCQDPTDEIHQNNETPCTVCYCRPMWCVDCMAKWFASRQDQHQKNQWLSSKCSCPMCRATFCILDVCMLGGSDMDTEE